jgi:SecD/SecF fusion protein
MLIDLRKLHLSLASRWIFTSALLLCVDGCAPKPPHHGTAFIVALDTNKLATVQEGSSSLTRTEEVLRRRMRGLGIQYFIERESERRLVIKVPQSSSNDLDMARSVIARAGILEFRMVHPESQALLQQDIGEPGYEVLIEQRVNRDGTKSINRHLVKKGAEQGLTGKHLKRAMVTRHQITKQPEIDFELNPEGAAIFANITKEFSPKGNRYYQLAIVLDGVLVSAPRIMGEIPGGRGQITGSFDVREAFELANLLENPLETPHRIIEERTF